MLSQFGCSRPTTRPCAVKANIFFVRVNNYSIYLSIYLSVCLFILSILSILNICSGRRSTTSPSLAWGTSRSWGTASPSPSPPSSTPATSTRYSSTPYIYLFIDRSIYCFCSDLIKKNMLNISVGSVTTWTRTLNNEHILNTTFSLSMYTSLIFQNY